MYRELNTGPACIHCGFRHTINKFGVLSKQWRQVSTHQRGAVPKLLHICFITRQVCKHAHYLPMAHGLVLLLHMNLKHCALVYHNCRLMVELCSDSSGDTYLTTPSHVALYISDIATGESRDTHRAFLSAHNCESLALGGERAAGKH